jgi:hypothetical protein
LHGKLTSGFVSEFRVYVFARRVCDFLPVRQGVYCVAPHDTPTARGLLTSALWYAG